MDSLLSLAGVEDVPIEEAYRRIDEAIEQHHLHILALKSRRNALAPISRLPSEIFCNIFLFARMKSMLYNRRCLKWIKLTHVTRHWRNIAVNSPSLWVDLPHRNLRWMEEMLKRSKDASVMLKVDFGQSYGITCSVSPGLELALEHSARIKNLSLLNVTPTLWNHLLKYLPESAPRLESLNIQRHGIDPYIGFDTGARHLEPICIPERVLCKTERLRRLELTNCCIDWSSHSHLHHCITHLKLHSLFRTSRPVATQFVDALNRMPYLEVLDLEDALPIRTSEQAPWASDHIHLPSLHTLNIRSTNAEIEPFLSCVTFPPTATVKVVVHCATGVRATTKNLTYSGDSSGIISGLARSYSNTSSIKIFQTIKLLNPSGGGFGVQIQLFATTLTKEWRPNPLGPPPRLELTFRWSENSSSSAKQALAKTVIDIFGGGIPLRHVKHAFFLERVSGVDHNLVSKTIGMLPRIYFAMTTVEARSFLEAVQHRVRWPRKGTAITSRIGSLKSSICFPSLSSICIYDARFDNSAANGSPDSNSITIGMLQDCLIRRYEHGAEIRKLRLRRCAGLQKKDVDLLAEIVVDVDWDGVQIFRDSEQEDESDYSYSYGD